MSALCQRCGKDVTDDEAPTLHKCSKCENIRFERGFFYPLERKIKRNFQKIKKITYNSFLTGLYQFGSFSNGKSECGDIDFLITYDEKKLEEIVDFEIKLFHSRYGSIHPDKDIALTQESSLLKEFWDFKTCDEYPECLECYESRGCQLPEEDYFLSLHTYCMSECKKRKKIRLPNCCFLDCRDLDRQIKERIIKDILEILIEGGIDYTLINSDQKIKVVDIIIKKTVNELQDEFDSMKMKKNLSLIRIF